MIVIKGLSPKDYPDNSRKSKKGESLVKVMLAILSFFYRYMKFSFYLSNYTK